MMNCACTVYCVCTVYNIIKTNSVHNSKLNNKACEVGAPDAICSGKATVGFVAGLVEAGDDGGAELEVACV